MGKIANTICILFGLILYTFQISIYSIESGNPTFLILSFIFEGTLFLIYHYLTKDYISSKFATRNT